jgi:hypothetical protein
MECRGTLCFKSIANAEGITYAGAGGHYVTASAGGHYVSECWRAFRLRALEGSAYLFRVPVGHYVYANAEGIKYASAGGHYVTASAGGHYVSECRRILRFKFSRVFRYCRCR